MQSNQARIISVEYFDSATSTSRTEQFNFELFSESVEKKARLSGLNIYLLSEASREQRDRLKGIKIELSALKNSIIKTNKKKYEYVALKDEEKQLRKLGIDL
jgi:hypothetical protein